MWIYRTVSVPHVAEAHTVTHLIPFKLVYIGSQHCLQLLKTCWEPHVCDSPVSSACLRRALSHIFAVKISHPNGDVLQV
jgi:hypothetical protein